MQVDAGGANIPGGEFFCWPVEDSATGTIAFTEFPAVYQGRELKGIRLRFEGGRVVEASAETNEEFLLETLDTDDGARRARRARDRLQPGITRYMRNTLFDEKIDGTVHVALGKGFPFLGGSNESAMHWDIVKDLRLAGSRIELDGEVVQRDGAWLLTPDAVTVRRSPLRQRPIVALVAAEVVSSLGSQMTFLALAVVRALDDRLGHQDGRRPRRRARSRGGPGDPVRHGRLAARRAPDDGSLRSGAGAAARLDSAPVRARLAQLPGAARDRGAHRRLHRALLLVAAARAAGARG